MTTSTTPTKPARLDAHALREWTAGTDGPRLLDVRTPAEFTTAHIPGSYNVRWTCCASTATSSAAGLGYATEAVQALIGVAFGTYGMRRVIAHVDSRNAASARLCERVGMKREAHLRQDCWTKGEWTDSLIYGLLAREWHGPRSSAVSE
jgi:rhodanese-related sulfurtransferase